MFRVYGDSLRIEINNIIHIIMSMISTSNFEYEHKYECVYVSEMISMTQIYFLLFFEYLLLMSETYIRAWIMA